MYYFTVYSYPHLSALVPVSEQNLMVLNDEMAIIQSTMTDMSPTNPVSCEVH